MGTLTKHQKKDIRLIGKFVEVYCAGKHAEIERARDNGLCLEKTDFAGKIGLSLALLLLIQE